MYHISDEVYDELALALQGRIAGQSYFSGTEECLSGDVRVRLRATLIIYRRRDQRPEGRFEPIVNIVPVWWECHTEWGADELLNDFDFAELKERIINGD